MRVEVLIIAGCDGGELALSRLREALVDVGHAEANVGIRTIIDRRDAEASAFAGSPTWTLDGVDLFPGGELARGLACRVYATPSGLAPAPTRDQIVERIRAHA